MACVHRVEDDLARSDDVGGAAVVHVDRMQECEADVVVLVVVPVDERAHDLARVLDVPVAYFFDDMSSTVAAKTPSRLRGFAEAKPEPFEPDPMARRETLELVRAYYRITDPQVRKRVFELAKTLGKTRRPDA